MSAERNVSTLLGDPRKAIIAMAVPIMVSLFVAEINTIADRAWVSGMGSDSMAAVAVVRPVYNVLVGLGAGLGVGASAVISRYIGAKNREFAASCAVQSVMLSAVIGLALTPILLLSQPYMLSAIGAGDCFDESMGYMRTYSLFVSLIIVNGAIGGVLNGQGASVLSTAMMIALAVSNIVLDPVFIYVLDMGVSGASVATVASTLISLMLGLFFLLGRRTYLSYDRSMMRFDRAHCGAVMAAGVPQMLEYLVLYGMDAALNFLVIMCAGTDGLTVFSTVDGLVILITVPAMAVGSALVPVASSAYGQRDRARMRSAFGYALAFGVGSVALLVALLLMIPEQSLYIFTYSDDMLPYREQMIAIMWMSVYAPMFSFNPVCSGYMQALKHPNRSVVLAVWRNVVLIAFFYMASSHSLDQIAVALVSGHVIGMISACLFAISTSRKADREYFSDAAGASPRTPA